MEKSSTIQYPATHLLIHLNILELNLSVEEMNTLHGSALAVGQNIKRVQEILFASSR